MRHFLAASTFTLAAVASVLAAGCTLPLGRVAQPGQAPARLEPTEPSSVAMTRETRYYRDDQGALWDDRGRRQEPRS